MYYYEFKLPKMWIIKLTIFWCNSKKIFLWSVRTDSEKDVILADWLIQTKKVSNDKSKETRHVVTFNYHNTKQRKMNFLGWQMMKWNLSTASFHNARTIQLFTFVLILQKFCIYDILNSLIPIKSNTYNKCCTLSGWLF